jgi:hypothetical protein
MKEFFEHKSMSDRLGLYHAVFVLNMFGSTKIASSSILSG